MKRINNEFNYLKNISESEKKKMLYDSIIVLDTNVLLNIYRLSYESSENLLNALNNFAKQIWLPYYVGVEFYKNKDNVAKEKIETLCKNVDDMKKRLDANCSNYKVINEIVVCDSTKQCEKYKEFIKMQKKELDDLVHKSKKKNDELIQMIDEKILNIFEDRITKKLDNETYKKVLSEGQFRMEHNIAPGYKDIKKNEYECGYRLNGDYIIFDSMKRLSKEKKKNIIFVSNDVKEDIYDKKNNCICFSLQKEFYDETGYKIVMMKNDEFNNFCNKIIKDKDEQINKTTKDELKSFSSFSMNQNITLNNLKYLNALNTLNTLNYLNNSLKELKDSTKNLSEIDNLKKLNDSISFFQQCQNNLRNISDDLDNFDKS